MASGETHRLMSFDRELRVGIYQHFADTTRAPTLEALAEQMGVSPETVRESLHRLAAYHAIALAPGSSAIWMAHPFSAVPTE